MRRFFVEGQNISGGVCAINGNEAHHIAHVLRMEPGQAVLLCSGDGLEHIAVLEQVGAEILSRIIDTRAGASEPACRITLYQGLPKGDKLEELCQRCTEAGVRAFVPVQCERSVARWTGKDAQRKLERLRSTVLSACKQCGRALVPEVSGMYSVAQAAKSSHQLKLIAYEDENALSLREAVIDNDAADIAVFIGPEGGISQSELVLLKENGWRSVSLGRRILRTENAGFAAAVLILGLRGDMEI